ncbi:hypothetical protein OIU79_019407 [Salix purpurea]|uniref:Uncharacterized protein n=1 Tax=Salix purpurea TaxID=77065 RepID=A0A9Q0P181_SALPP|nr:hypothetical protein OIU79_019407 [Salix purpurea]
MRTSLKIIQKLLAIFTYSATMIFQNLNLTQPSRENNVSYESVKRQKMDINVHLNYVVAESILSN